MQIGCQMIRQSVPLQEKKTLDEYCRKVCNGSDVSKVKLPLTRENVPLRKSIVTSLNISVETTNKIGNQDLQLKKAKT